MKRRMGFAKSPRIFGRAATHKKEGWGPRSHKPLCMLILKDIWIVMINPECHIAKLRLGLMGL